MLLRRSLSILAAALALGGCDPGNPASAGEVENTLVFTRQDGTRVEFADRFFVWCGRWEPNVATPSVHVATRSLVNGRGWHLTAVRADVGSGATVFLPRQFIRDQPQGARLFVPTGDDEFSSDDSNAAGTISFEEVSCERGGTVRFSVDGVLGSEEGGATLRVTGAFTGEVGSPPS